MQRIEEERIDECRTAGSAPCMGVGWLVGVGPAARLSAGTWWIAWYRRVLVGYACYAAVCALDCMESQRVALSDVKSQIKTTFELPT